RIPDREGEYPVQSSEHIDAIPEVEVKQHLRIRMPPEQHPITGESISQRTKVIYLAIKDDHRPMITVDHRLMTGGRKIDDRESTVSQAEAMFRREEQTGIIRPTMGNHGTHLCQQTGVEPTLESSNTTHIWLMHSGSMALLSQQLQIIDVDQERIPKPLQEVINERRSSIQEPPCMYIAIEEIKKRPYQRRQTIPNPISQPSLALGLSTEEARIDFLISLGRALVKQLQRLAHGIPIVLGNPVA